VLGAFRRAKTLQGSADSGAAAQLFRVRVATEEFPFLVTKMSPYDNR
jgi:hypothetical protein